MIQTALNTKPGGVSYVVLTGFGLTQVGGVLAADDANAAIAWDVAILSGRSDNRLGLKFTTKARPVTKGSPATTAGNSGNITITLNSGTGTLLFHEAALDVPYIEE